MPSLTSDRPSKDVFLCQRVKGKAADCFRSFICWVVSLPSPQIQLVNRPQSLKSQHYSKSVRLLHQFHAVLELIEHNMQAWESNFPAVIQSLQHAPQFHVRVAVIRPREACAVDIPGLL